MNIIKISLITFYLKYALITFYCILIYKTLQINNNILNIQIKHTFCNFVYLIINPSYLSDHKF